MAPANAADTLCPTLASTLPCSGGSPLTAMNYAAANNQTTDALYPYTSGST